MVGTERHSAALPQWPGEIGRLLRQISDTAAGSTGAGSTTGVQIAADPASVVLRMAAVLATCSLAGAQGVAWTQALPEPAATDTLPALPAGPLLVLADWCLREGPPRLQHQLLAALAASRQVLPPAQLPQLLELGRRSLSLRPLLAPVLGERGRWLAAQREDWRYAAGVTDEAPAESLWQHGSFEQRRDFFRRERAVDPAAARERLDQARAELPAKERAELVAELATGLSMADEPFLDTLRSDRGREVRQAALSLLLRLPDAQHPRRAAGRLAALMGAERGLLQRQRWTLNAPEQAGTDWLADSVDKERPKNEPLGERAWWLYQLVRQVPLAWWTQHTGLDPAALRDWAEAGDWRDALLRGWREVLIAAPDGAWCEAFVERWPDTVLPLLPPARREQIWLQQWQAGQLRLDVLLPRVLAATASNDGLSRELSLSLAAHVLGLAKEGRLLNDYGLRQLLPELACALHPDALQALQQLPRSADETPALADTLHSLGQVIDMRLRLQQLPAPSPALSTAPDTRTP